MGKRIEEPTMPEFVWSPPRTWCGVDARCSKAAIVRRRIS
jgi:hypothetical protein